MDAQEMDHTNGHHCAENPAALEEHTQVYAWAMGSFLTAICWAL